MDYLFQRYANPYPLLEGMISTGRLCEFVEEFIKTRNDEEEHKAEWEFWLHKVFDKSWAEFRECLNPTETIENAAPTQAEMEETIQASMQMLNGFSLGGGADGTIQAAGNNRN